MLPTKLEQERKVAAQLNEVQTVTKTVARVLLKILSSRKRENNLSQLGTLSHTYLRLAAFGRRGDMDELKEVVEKVNDEIHKEWSLFKTFAKSLAKGGWVHALEQLGRKVLQLAVPVSEVLLVGVSVFVVLALMNYKDAKRHSVLLSGAVTGDREPPRDIMKPHFFQNRQGLWIHHGLWWNEEKYGPAKAVVVLLHGHSEHSKRFAHVAEHFNKKGFAVFGMDHQGFGRSEGDRGHVEDFEDYVDDVLEFLVKVVYEDHAHWQKLPRFMAAHSMGSLITIHAAHKCQSSSHPAHQLSGIMLSAPALKVDPARNTWYIRAGGALLDFLAPKAAIISFPSYPSTSFLQVKMHSSFDPLNYQGSIRVHQGLELLRGTRMALELAPEFKTPILIVHGVEDLHADIGGSREFMGLIKSTDKLMIELPNIRHEPWQEERHIRDPILDFVTSWAVDRAGSGKVSNNKSNNKRSVVDLTPLLDVEAVIYKCESSPSEPFKKKCKPKHKK